MIASQSSTHEIIKRTNLLSYGFSRVRFLKRAGCAQFLRKILLSATRRKSFKWLCLSETFRNGSQYGQREQKQINDHHHRLLDLCPRPFPRILGNIPPGTFILFCKHGDISNWVKIETCSADPGPAHDREWPPTSPRTTLHRPHGLNCSSFFASYPFHNPHV